MEGVRLKGGFFAFKGDTLTDLTPLQRAEAIRRLFPQAEVSSSFGSVVVGDNRRPARQHVDSGSAEAVTAWANSRRRQRLGKSGWQQQADARRILRNHHGICHVCGGAGATEVDHVIPLCEGGPDTDANKRPIHAKPCHVDKTRAEAHRARPTRKRPQPQHPGVIEGGG